MADVTVLDVLLHGVPIATLTRVSDDRILFALNEAYIADDRRPTLSLGFKDHLGGLITDFRTTRTKALPFFSNLLPEGHLRTYLAERAGVNPEREFFLLWALGMDLPGAVKVQPAGVEEWPSDSRDGTDQDRRRPESPLRFSLAGVQLKFSAIEEAREGLTIPAEGIGGSWIVKLPSREFAGVPENEYAMMTLARLVGMDVPALRLVEIDAIQNLPEGIGKQTGLALAIERFDRLQDGPAVHIEDFAQVFGVYPRDKYRNASARSIARVLRAEGSDADVVEFVRRLTFNTLIGNADMHLKNWSLVYPDRRHAALAPAYDLLSTIPYIPDENAALSFSRTKRFDEFSAQELSHLAAKARLPQNLVLHAAHETVALFHQYWQSEKKNLPISADVIHAVETHLKKIPIA